MVDTLKSISIIVLLIIYIPVTVMIIAKWKKRLTRFVFLPIAILSLPVLYIVIFSAIPYYELMPFEGRVIDADTKEPIEGAVVLAVYFDEAITIAGTNTYPIDAQETLTDRKGEFKISEVREWFGPRPGTVVKAEVIIFKPGYGVYPNHRRAKAVGGNKAWPHPGEYIVYELPRLKTREERDNNLPSLHLGDISKEKYSTLLGLINEERTFLGYEKLPLD